MRPGLALLLFSTVVMAGCQGALSEAENSPTTRAPLSSPPDPGQPPLDDGLAASERDVIAASTVRVTGVACGRTTEGSGFAVANDLIVTNAHVLVGVSQPTIELGPERHLTGSVIGHDLDQDLALIRVGDANFVPLPLANAVDGAVGAIFGWEPEPQVDATPFRLDREVIVRIEAVGSAVRVERPSLLLAASIESGDSGAAVVNSDGAVIGVAYAASTSNGNAAYAVASSEVERLIRDAQTGAEIAPVGEC